LKNPPFFEHVGFSFLPFGNPLGKKWIIDWFVRVDFLYLIPPNEQRVQMANMQSEKKKIKTAEPNSFSL
jgi:hypothetical protein